MSHLIRLQTYSVCGYEIAQYAHVLYFHLNFHIRKSTHEYHFNLGNKYVKI